MAVGVSGRMSLARKYSRLGRGPAAQALQTRIWLRGETNADGIASGDVKPEGPGWFGYEPCTTAPAQGLELRPLAAKPAW